MRISSLLRSRFSILILGRRRGRPVPPRGHFQVRHWSHLASGWWIDRWHQRSKMRRFPIASKKIPRPCAPYKQIDRCRPNASRYQNISRSSIICIYRLHPAATYRRWKSTTSESDTIHFVAKLHNTYLNLNF